VRSRTQYWWWANSDLDPVDRQILNQAVDDGVDEHDPDHPHTWHERLAEHGVGQIDITKRLRLVLGLGDSVHRPGDNREVLRPMTSAADHGQTATGFERGNGGDEWRS